MGSHKFRRTYVKSSSPIKILRLKALASILGATLWCIMDNWYFISLHPRIYPEVRHFITCLAMYIGQGNLIKLSIDFSGIGSANEFY